MQKYAFFRSFSRKTPFLSILPPKSGLRTLSRARKGLSAQKKTSERSDENFRALGRFFPSARSERRSERRFFLQKNSKFLCSFAEKPYFCSVFRTSDELFGRFDCPKANIHLSNPNPNSTFLTTVTEHREVGSCAVSKAVWHVLFV